MTSVIFDGIDEDVGNIIKVKINTSNQNTIWSKYKHQRKVVSL